VQQLMESGICAKKYCQFRFWFCHSCSEGAFSEVSAEGVADASSASMEGAANGANVAAKFSSIERQGLRELFGSSKTGAEALLNRLSQGPITLPPGVTTETLEAYAKVAQSSIDAGKDTLGVQALRLRAINIVLGR
jgi:hypothetical protein